MSAALDYYLLWRLCGVKRRENLREKLPSILHIGKYIPQKIYIKLIIIRNFDSLISSWKKMSLANKIGKFSYRQTYIVPHNHLTNTLDNYSRIRGKNIKWINCSYKWDTTSWNIILFGLYINDFSSVLLYADDVKFFFSNFRSIKC